MGLTSRQERLLQLIVEHFIDTGEPVGSKFLSTVYGTNISSATIRNEMASLFRDGFLEQPHTSAGRIPSDTGYRYYIRYLMPEISLPSTEKYKILQRLDTFAGDPREVLRSGTETLAEISDCITLCSTPLSRGNKISRLEIAVTGKNTAVVILKTDTGVIRQKVIRTNAEIDFNTVQLFYNLAASFFNNSSPMELTRAAIQNTICSLGDRAFAMIPIISAAVDLALESEKAEIIVSGRGNVFHHREISLSAHSILELTENAESMKKLLDNNSDGIGISIGAENGFPELRATTVLTCPYRIGNITAGTIGIIGPIGMDYPKLIPYIKFITSKLSEILSEEA